MLTFSTVYQRIFIDYYKIHIKDIQKEIREDGGATT